MHVFTSKYHPGSASRPLVFGRWLVRPLAMILLPVMIITLVVALQGYPILGFLYYGFPLGVGLAWIWTWYVLQTTLATIIVDEEAIAVKSVWQQAEYPPTSPAWERLFDLRQDRESITMSLGLQSYDLSLQNWQDADVLLKALIRVRHATRR